MTPAELLAEARALLERRSSATRGLWPRAAALLGRQALEQAIVDREPLLATVPGRVRMLALRSVIGDADVAGRATHLWATLSRTTHHDDYELPPTAEELLGWFAELERVLDRLARA